MMKPVSLERIGPIARALESVDQVIEGRLETSTRALSLVDKMHRQQTLPFDLWAAADHYRQLYFASLGESEGVSSYGNSPGGGNNHGSELTANSRLPQGLRRLYRDRSACRTATLAMFAVPDKAGTTLIFDEDLARLVLPAILMDHADVTQTGIAMERSSYRGKAQSGAAGGTIVIECLHRLALHFGLRK